MSNIGTIVQHVGGHGMAEQMTATGFCDACKCFVISDFLADIAFIYPESVT